MSSYHRDMKDARKVRCLEGKSDLESWTGKDVRHFPLLIRPQIAAGAGTVPGVAARTAPGCRCPGGSNPEQSSRPARRAPSVSEM